MRIRGKRRNNAKKDGCVRRGLARIVRLSRASLRENEHEGRAPETAVQCSMRHLESSCPFYGPTATWPRLRFLHEEAAAEEKRGDDDDRRAYRSGSEKNAAEKKAEANLKRAGDHGNHHELRKPVCKPPRRGCRQNDQRARKKGAHKTQPDENRQAEDEKKN